MESTSRRSCVPRYHLGGKSRATCIFCGQAPGGSQAGALTRGPPRTARKQGQKGKGPSPAWEVVGLSGWDRDQWPESALGRPEASAFPSNVACAGEAGAGPTQALPRNAYCLLILSLAQAGVLGHLAG